MMTFRTLKTSELDVWYEHCQGVFVGEAAGYFRRHYEMDPAADASLIFVAMDGDTIAATVRVFARKIWLAGRAVAMGGIGEVSTKPAYRRQGLAAELLQMAIAEMEVREMPVSILFGDQRIYEQAGWRHCEMPRVSAPVSALPSLGDGYALRPYADADLPALMGMYDLFAGRMDGAVQRDEAYWRRWVLPQWTPPLVLEKDGTPLAYASVKPQEDGALRIEELGASPLSWTLLPGFLRALAEHSGSVQLFASLCPELPGAMPAKPSGMMVRLNRPIGELHTSDALVASMKNAGMFGVDHF